MSEQREEQAYATKREEYLTLAIPEYWIVDFRQQQVMVLTRQDGPDGLAWSERVFRSEQVIASEILAGYTGTVAELSADVDADQTDAS